MALSHGPSESTSTHAPAAPRSGLRSAVLAAAMSFAAACTTVGSPRGSEGNQAHADGQSFDGSVDGGSRRDPDIQLLDLGSFPTIDVQEPVDAGNNPQPTPDAGTPDTGADTGPDTAETTPDTVGADTVSKLQNCLQAFQGKACDASVNPKTKIKIKGTWNCQPEGTPNCVPN